MPNNWKTYKLEKVATLQRGFDLPNTKRIDGKYPVIAASGFSTWHNEFKVKAPGVTTGRSGTLGQVHFVKEDFWPLNTSLWVKDFHGNDERFIYYFLKTLNFEEYNSGTSVPTLNRNDVHKLDVSIPSLEEQKSIAAILSTIDDKIENNLAINKTLEEMAMALYKHWFVDFGPFQDGEFVESELGRIPKGWEVKKLGDLYDTTSGGTPSRTKMEYYENGTIQWIKSKELDNTFIIDTEEKITEVALLKSSAKRFPQKSVLIAMYGATVGEIAINSEIATCNQAICVIKQTILPYYYVFLFLKNEKENILNQAVGSAQQNISQIIIKNLQLLKPKLKDVEYLFAELDAIFNKIESNIKENQTLTQLRDTLLPKLISGEVRLKEFRESITN